MDRPTPAEPASQAKTAPRQRMHLNLLTLAFSGPQARLEERFLDDYHQSSLVHVRIALVTGALFYGAFAILDHLALPLQKHTAWLIRFALVCPAILATIACTYRPWFKRRMQPLFSALIVLGGIGITWVIAIAPPPARDEYYTGLILLLIFSYTFIRARFLWAAMTGWVVVAVYEVVVAAWTATPGRVLVSNSFFLVSANLAGMATCYAMEHSARRHFFLAWLLDQEREKVALANAGLEMKVEERTVELQQSNRQLQEEMAERQRAEDERMRLQQQLKQAEKLEAIGKLAAGVAHDLNNILAGLVTYPDLLLFDLAEDSPLREPMLTIRQSGMRAAAIVQDLLTLSRQGMTEKRVVRLNGIAGDYLRSPEFRQLKLDHPNVGLEIDLQQDLLDVCGSSVHLSKALMNLVSNAFEANLVGGTVRIATRNAYVDRPLECYERVPEGEYTILRVTDTGVGIAADDLRRIFEPFFTKKKLGRSGTGLGMTLVWSTVKDHGGFIDVQSEEGRGTAIALYLPATRQPASDGERVLTLEDCRGTERVLVVDDVPEQREIATSMLRKLGYDARAVPSGEAAIEYLAGESVQILVLDMIMDPGIDGCETYARIVEAHPGQKAVIASGFSQSERVGEAQRLGAGEYVRKPYTLERIARAIRRELDRS